MLSRREPLLSDEALSQTQPFRVNFEYLLDERFADRAEKARLLPERRSVSIRTGSVRGASGSLDHDWPDLRNQQLNNAES